MSLIAPSVSSPLLQAKHYSTVIYALSSIKATDITGAVAALDQVSDELSVRVLLVAHVLTAFLTALRPIWMC